MRHFREGYKKPQTLCSNKTPAIHEVTVPCVQLRPILGDPNNSLAYATVLCLSGCRL